MKKRRYDYEGEVAWACHEGTVAATKRRKRILRRLVRDAVHITTACEPARCPTHAKLADSIAKSLVP